MGGSASDKTVNVGSCSPCPIVRGAGSVVQWALSRFPHAVRAACLVLVAVAAASIYNASNDLGLPWRPSPGNRVGIPRAFESRLPQIDAAQALSLYEGGEALFVDSRDEEDYQRDHIPGAVNAPMGRWTEIWPEIESALPRDRLLVLYCYGAHCGLSTRQGKELLRQGYSDLVVLDYGWNTWTEHGHPTMQHPEGHPRRRSEH